MVGSGETPHGDHALLGGALAIPDRLFLPLGTASASLREEGPCGRKPFGLGAAAAFFWCSARGAP